MTESYQSSDPLRVIAGGKWLGCELGDIDTEDLQFIESQARGPGFRGAVRYTLRKRKRRARRASSKTIRHSDDLLAG